MIGLLPLGVMVLVLGMSEEPCGMYMKISLQTGKAGNCLLVPLTIGQELSRAVISLTFFSYRHASEWLTGFLQAFRMEERGNLGQKVMCYTAEVNYWLRAAAAVGVKRWAKRKRGRHKR